MVTEEQLKLMQEQLEQSTKLLREMKEKQVVSDGNSIQNPDKIKEIEEDIHEHEMKIAFLKEKLSDMSNYQRIDQNTKESLEGDKLWQNYVETIRQGIIDSISKYHKLQAQVKQELDSYQNELRELKTIISEMELKLNHDTIAKRQGLESKAYFSVDDKVDYVQQMIYFQTRVTKIIKIISFLTDEVHMYDDFIAKENSKLSAIDKNANMLNEIKEYSSNVSMPPIDAYALCADKVSLSKEENLLNMLRKQLNELVYNPFEKMEKQIAANESALGNSKKENQEFIKNAEEQLIETTEKDEKDPIRSTVEAESIFDGLVKSEEVLDEFLKSVGVVQKQTTEDNNVLQETNVSSVKEETISHDLKHPSEEMIEALKEENIPVAAISIENAPDTLKQGKGKESFKKSWNEWASEMKAAAITVEIPKITNAISPFEDGEKKKDDSSENGISNMQLGSNASLYSGVALDRTTMVAVKEENLKVK